MAARWLVVYRNYSRPDPSVASRNTVPPERHFPVPVVVTHGVLAITTVALVLFTLTSGS
jgi:hypothetical protein